MKKRFGSIAAVLMIVLGVTAVQAWAAADYPTRQITYLITFDPGGQSDREARRQQPHLERILKQKVMIDYKVGGGGALGWRELVRAKPDGYFMAGFNMPHIILQPLQQEVGYKTEQILPVAIFQQTPLALVVHAKSNITTLQEFIDFAKKNPGSLTLGGTGSFTSHQMASLRLQKIAGIKLTYVPFTGSAPLMTAVLGGHVSCTFSNSDDVVRFKDQLRVLGFATEKRFPAAPNVQTFKEMGYDVLLTTDRGVAVPPGTPEAVIQKLEAAFLEISRNPAIQEEMTKQGFVPVAMGHKESIAHKEKMAVLYKEMAADLKK
ncbi:MAG: tripartite tricarboxylate transporter substrate binding protein [Deltaproteobacteria bacterium]|nr:tripartite tricarboxylate transporter substrate binding protein [Deltaproteobacteria bacterium]